MSYTILLSPSPILNVHTVGVVHLTPTLSLCRPTYLNESPNADLINFQISYCFLLSMQYTLQLHPFGEM